MKVSKSFLLPSAVVLSVLLVDNITFAFSCNRQFSSRLGCSFGGTQKLLSSSSVSSLVTKRTSSKRFSSNDDSVGSRNGSGNYDYALLFDCDGVILETEEFHRLAYNEAFQTFNLSIDDKPVEWSVKYYDLLQNTVGGGIPKMFYHFRTTMNGKFPKSNYQFTGDNDVQEEEVGSTPETLERQEELIKSIQSVKTKAYKRLVENEALCRPGVLQLMDDALADPTIAVGVCSASTKEAAQKTLSKTLGQDRIEKLNVCILGDDVSEKKPSPLIYNVARERIGNIAPDRCVVIEDSLIGLRAAKGAGMKCLITYTSSTADCDFYGEGADAKVPDLVTGKVTVNAIFDSMKKGVDSSVEFLASGLKDPTSNDNTN